MLKRVFQKHKGVTVESKPVGGATKADLSTGVDASGAQFGCVPGVLRTRVGYTGGAKIGPTYYSLGDHTETVEIDYNPKFVTYRDLLKIFWVSHNSTACMSRQYMSAIFYHNEDQQVAAEETKNEHQKVTSQTIQTKIKQFEVFYNAEDYHQKYLLRQQSKILKALGLSNQQLIESTVAAKLNGYIGGHGDLENVDKDLEGSNLPPEIVDMIKKKVSKGALN
ncbi:Peptide methionine sulfoxide reductase-like [Oopsacas minuta]|uniref:peptide-methionine (S)-S-oxide reductase n=1 Tax=Oopsacas minuta TaxID=111878 RepID=A0AAV7K8Q0_9METZ|nr:Peptide methionine sulfoxide reductase-like [Oopsacas minuta]